MDEYIDRQAAIDAIATWDKQDVYPPCLYEMVINEVPSADVAPVRRGYWIGGELGSCSVCGHHGCASDIWDNIEIGGQTFCPACGAILDDEYCDEEDDDNVD